MAEEMLSYSEYDMQACRMVRGSKDHTSGVHSHKREHVRTSSSDMAFVTFARGAR